MAEPLTSVVQLRLRPEVLAALDGAAHELDMHRSELIRAVIETSFVMHRRPGTVLARRGDQVLEIEGVEVETSRRATRGGER